MNQKTVIGIVAVLIIIIGGIYYFGGYNYGSPANTASQTPNTQGPNQVSIKGFAFSPAELNVSKGDTVTWTNNDSVTHTISGSGFKSGDLANGQSYSFTFTAAGSYDYSCGIHPTMKGKIIVK